MIFVFSLVSAALLCIASFVCYKVSGKMLDEKDAEKCAKEAELEEKLINHMMQTRSKPLLDDEFSFGGAYEALVMAGERQKQLQAGVRYARKQMMSFYGLWPMPPSSVRVSPDIYLKSGMASWTQTRPISVSALP